MNNPKIHCASHLAEFFPHLLETWPTHFSPTQCCQFYHLNSPHFYPVFYILTASDLGKTLITSYLDYSKGLKTNLPALSLALPVHSQFHTLTHEAPFAWNCNFSSYSL